MLSEAIALHQAGNLSEAERLYRLFLQDAADHADACALLGVVVGARGDYEEAIGWVNKAVALDPQSGLLYLHQGTVLMAAQKLPEAIRAFRRAVELQPTIPQIHFNFANALRSSEDWGGAIQHYREALDLDPTFLDAYNNLALSLVHEKKYEEALDLALKVVALNDHYGEGWLTLCNIAEKLKNYDLAVKAGKRTTELMPENHYAWFGYGVALNRVNRDQKAIEAYKRALSLKPSRADIWDNLGQSYQALNLLEEAEKAFIKAVEVAGQIIPDEKKRLYEGPPIDESEYGNRHWHLALIELLRGKYKEGFARYRARVKEIPELKRPAFALPLWRGEDLKGKTLLVCDEQGFGDTLMLARFLKTLRKQNVRIVFSVHKVLAPLLRGWDGADSIIVHGDKIPPCDYFCSSFDLPYCLGTTLQNLPSVTPYVEGLPPDTDTYLSLGLPKIGVVWGGSPLHLNDQRRSIPLKIFSTLFSLPHFKFYSFNRDMKEGDEEILASLPVENLAPHIKDFAMAARLIGQMDLVITCDTATAHLAGALGKTTWVLLPFAPDWRWLTDRTDSPWYPTMRLFRQPSSGDWVSVLAYVKTRLETEKLP